VPAPARPYVGGSQNNSILELTLGYNGLGRLNGDETGGVGGFGSGKDEPGWLRMFNASQGGQISWLLPAALILLVAGLVLTARTDRLRAGLVLWGGWLVITGLVFSLMQGIFHEYYTVALAPAVGAVVGIGAALTWRAIRSAPSWHAPFGTVMLALAIGVSAWWSYTLLGRSADFLPWLRWAVLIGGLAAAVGALGLMRLPTRVAAVIACVALGATLAGSAAYAVQTASEPHTGSIPSAGPAVLGGFPGGAPGGAPGGGFPGANGGQQGGAQQGGGPGGPGDGMGGLLDVRTVSDQMRSLLDQNASSYTWVAATVGSQNASGYQLATGDPVMAIGGFNGSDPSPTLEKFQRYVADRKIHYFIGDDDLGGGRAGNSTGGSTYSSQISEWVSANFTARTVDDIAVYDLTQRH
jgi:4-amino-4-deoxy-L-arabinose transferase-like glycosyltransferase